MPPSHDGTLVYQGDKFVGLFQTLKFDTPFTVTDEGDGTVRITVVGPPDTPAKPTAVVDVTLRPGRPIGGDPVPLLWHDATTGRQWYNATVNGPGLYRMCTMFNFDERLSNLDDTTRVVFTIRMDDRYGMVVHNYTGEMDKFRQGGTCHLIHQTDPVGVYVVTARAYSKTWIWDSNECTTAYAKQCQGHHAIGTVTSPVVLSATSRLLVERMDGAS